MTERIEMEFYDSEQEDRDIHWDDDVARWEQKQIKDWASVPEEENPLRYLSTREKKKLKLQTKMTTSGHYIVGASECIFNLVNFTISCLPYRPGLWEPVDYRTRKSKKRESVREKTSEIQYIAFHFYAI